MLWDDAERVIWEGLHVALVIRDGVVDGALRLVDELQSAGRCARVLQDELGEARIRCSWAGSNNRTENLDVVDTRRVSPGLVV